MLEPTSKLMMPLGLTPMMSMPMSFESGSCLCASFSASLRKAKASKFLRSKSTSLPPPNRGDAGYNVGQGTASPGAKLNVNLDGPGVTEKFFVDEYLLKLGAIK